MPTELFISDSLAPTPNTIVSMRKRYNTIISRLESLIPLSVFNAPFLLGVGNIMNINPIYNDTDYRATLLLIDSLMTSKADTPDGEKLDVLTTLVEAYEREHYPMDAPDPIDAIKFAMEQQELSPKDLEPMIGRRNRVYEILNRKRPLTLRMIRKLHQQLGIPAESLISQPEHRQY